MNEDMRERFETFVTTQMLDSVARDDEGQYRNHDVKFAENVWKAAWQAALSSAGTSGTPCRLCEQGFPLKHIHYGTQRLGMIPDTPCGDSLSGKGEATAQVMGADSPSGTANSVRELPPDSSAPDRAEELAREIVNAVQGCEEYFKPCPKCVVVVASLLRREMGR